jgi:hypothetical protein
MDDHTTRVRSVTIRLGTQYRDDFIIDIYSETQLVMLSAVFPSGEPGPRYTFRLDDFITTMKSLIANGGVPNDVQSSALSMVPGTSSG